MCIFYVIIYSLIFLYIIDSGLYFRLINNIIYLFLNVFKETKIHNYNTELTVSKL